LFDNSDPDRKSWSAAHWDGLKNGHVYARQVELLMGDDIHRAAAELTPEILEQIFLRKHDSAPFGATRAMSYLRPALNHFAKRGLCAYNLLDLASDHKTKTVRRERVLTPDEWVCIWKAAGTVMFNMGPAGLAIRTLMMTGARNREVAAMQVDELHLDRYEWHLPKDRSKNEEPHIFCLPAKAVEQIKQALVMKEHHNIPGPWVFSKKGKAPVMIGSKIKTGMDCRSGVKDWVFHDLRRTFATQLAERGFSGEIVDMCLNHKASASRGGVAGVYNRSVRLEDRHNAANGWQNITNNWLDETTSNDNVVKLA
jgi:integrase